MIWIRESFGAKLLSALVGTVGLLLIVTLVIVRTVTNQQVDAVAARTTENAGTLFEERSEQQRQMVARLARPFTESRRALFVLDAAIEEGAVDNLAGYVEYEMNLQGLNEALLVFTDAEGVPVLSVIRGERFTDGDPANIGTLAMELLDGDSLETRAYRVLDGTMYNVRSLYLELGRRPIGTITFGLPVETRDVQAIGNLGGFEACLHFEGVCVVQTEGVDTDPELAAANCRAYKDWMFDFCKPYPGRLIPVAHIPTLDVEEGVKELRRTAKLGVKAGMISWANCSIFSSCSSRELEWKPTVMPVTPSSAYALTSSRICSREPLNAGRSPSIAAAVSSMAPAGSTTSSGARRRS
ncbi:MAG: amidohydrolase family protein [Chloroflexi bacterium]|nr:amidohydrolase family protein [Chloroflexota bacterium]